MKRFLLFFISIQLIAFSSNAQTTTDPLDGREPVNTITTSVPFLMITPDSRAGAMGEVGAATSPDANSMHWNAAKYSFTDSDFGLAISYTPWLRALIGDINLSYLAVFVKPDRRQTIGYSMRYFSLGSIAFIDVSGSFLTDFTPNEFALDGSYSLKLSPDLSAGVAIRYLRSNLTNGAYVGGTESHPGSSVAGDLSFYYQKDITIAQQKAQMAYGLNISNIGQKISYTDESTADFLPTNLRLGASLTSHFDEFNSLSVALDINKLLVPTPPTYDGAGTDADNIIEGKDPNVSVPVGIIQSFSDAPGGSSEEFHELYYSLGIEYWYDKRFAIRGGYFHEHETKGNRKFFTLGIGLQLNVFGLDFAYLMPINQHNPLENTLRFTLSFDFANMNTITTTE